MTIYMTTVRLSCWDYKYLNGTSHYIIVVLKARTTICLPRRSISKRLPLNALQPKLKQRPQNIGLHPIVPNLKPTLSNNLISYTLASKVTIHNSPIVLVIALPRYLSDRHHYQFSDKGIQHPKCFGLPSLKGMPLYQRHLILTELMESDIEIFLAWWWL